MSWSSCRAAAVGRGVLVAVVVVAVAGLLAEGKLLPGVPAMAFKAGGSVAFVLLSLLSGGLSSSRGRVMVAALVACLVGDVYGAGSFLALVASFLVAQTLFIIAYLGRRGDRRRGALVFVVFLLAAASVLATLRGRVGGLDLALAMAYALVISVMVGSAASAAHLRGGRLILAAAVLFYVSDIFVAYSHFGGGFAYGWLWCPTYYSACSMLAYGAGLVGAWGQGG